MSIFGLIGLVVAFAGVALSVVTLLAGYIAERRGKSGLAENLSWAGCATTVLTAASLTFCCGVLVFCFMTGDTSIQYVLQYRSDAEGLMGVLYRLSGLWAGREGSLLFWAWLISLFNAVLAIRAMRRPTDLDHMAIMVAQLVLSAFVGVCLFSETNMPFTATPIQYFDANGNLQGAALMWGLNPLLEHWAQAIHPPTLFIGYAGLTVPFAYAMAALITNDSSKRWVERSGRFAMFSWLLLGIGIGLGAVWAYVVLGWGGYWGWDPVENASLLSWLVALALVHSFTVYRQRGAFRRWSIMCACLTFAFVIVGTFITRSGIVQSVHAFEGDPVSLTLFGSLIAVSVLAGIVGLVIRWKSFAGEEGMESLVSRDAAYYFNNVIMIVFTLVLAYLTVSSALPSWLPFGGQSLSAGTYDAIARPLGIIYCAIIAVCPLLSWGKTDRKAFLKQIKIPAICALVMFAALMAYFVTTLLPAYNATIAAGGMEAEGLASEGPAWYYNGLAVVGFAVASLLFFTTLTMIVRSASKRSKATGKNPFVSFFSMIAANSAKYGGYIAHFAMSIILIGLIGSSMFVTEKTGYMGYDEETDTASEAFTIDNYELVYTGNSVEQQANGEDVLYTVEFDVFDTNTGDQVGHVNPSVLLTGSTQQQKYNASVLGFPMHDLFVVYKGVNMDGDFALDVRINPMIRFVWVGFFLLMLGTLIGAFGRRKDDKDESPKKAEGSLTEAEPAEATRG